LEKKVKGRKAKGRKTKKSLIPVATQKDVQVPLQAQENLQSNAIQLENNLTCDQLVEELNQCSFQGKNVTEENGLVQEKKVIEDSNIENNVLLSDKSVVITSTSSENTKNGSVLSTPREEFEKKTYYEQK